MMCVLFQAHESLTISRYELTPAVDIERGYLSKSGAGSAGFVFLCLKSLGLPKFETYEFERFGGNYDSIYLAGEGLAAFFESVLVCLS